MLITGCSSEKPDGKDYLFTVSVVGNPNSLDPQSAENASAYDVVANIFTGLFTYDEQGELCKGVAESYEISADELEYTFTLGENFWGGKNIEEPVALIADDFVFAFSRKSIEYVDEVIAVDDKTVKYVLKEKTPDFLTILTLPVAMPCSRLLFENCKGRYGLDEDSIPSNGSFFVEKWQYDPYGFDNVIYTKRNNSNKDISPSRLNYRILEDYDSTLNRFKEDKELSIVKTLKPIEDYEYFSITDKTIGLVAKDEILGKLLAYATVREGENVAYGIIPPAVKFKSKSYRELVNEKSIDVYDSIKAENLKSTYEVASDIEILTCSDIVDTSMLYVYKNQYEEILDCNISFDVQPFDEYSRKLQAEEYTLCIKLISAEYNSPYAFLSQSEDFTPTNNIDDYAQKEKEIAQKGEFIPLYYSSVYFNYKKNLDGFVYIPYTQQLIFRYARNYTE
jgi:oligopeptide transport system substrate-binding protein